MTQSILLVKTSSLGDLIHALPAISDVRSLANGARLDWVVEQSLAALPRLHSGVSDVIPVAIRRWRAELWRREIRRDIAAYLQRVRRSTYDAVIDAQGLLKSAIVTLAARGPRYGLDFHSSREPLALFYHRTFRIPWHLHAVERTRLLLARVLEYDVPARCEYGIAATARRFDWLPATRYAVLLHATSGDYKLWPERCWLKLGAALNGAGVGCVLPWGSEAERERSMRLAAGMRSAFVPPRLDFDELAALFVGSQSVVGVDTGLTHLAAALGRPTVGIYCGTDPAATGIYGCARAVNLGGIRRSPDTSQVLAAVEKLAA